MKFQLHDKTSAPQASRTVMEAAEKAFGFIPNLYAVFAESPAAIEAYAAINSAIEKSALSPIEQQVVALAVSTENNCSYCVGAHSVIAGMVNMPEDILEQLRNGQPLSDPKFEALRSYTQSVVEKRGWVSEELIDAFISAGYSTQHILDVLTIVSLKTLSNYTNHVAHTPLDEQFASQMWPQS